jgi:hypothetical protein
MWRVWGKREVCTGCWWGNQRERGHWGDPDVDRRILLRYNNYYYYFIYLIK